MRRPRSLQAQGFRLSFTPLPGSFSPFLHSTLLYRSLSSIQPCGVVPARSHRVPRVPWYSGSCSLPPAFAYGALTLFGRPFQAVPLASGMASCSPNPGAQRAPVWAPPISLAATLGIEFFFLFLRLLRCFSSPGSPRAPMDSARGGRGLLGRVSPFRDLRVVGHLLLAAAYRSLSRLSSALSAKASALRPS